MKQTAPKEKPWEDGGRDQGDASISQGTSKIARDHQKMGESLEKILPHGLRRNQTCCLLTPFPQTSGLQNCDNQFLLFKLPSVWSFVRAASRNEYRSIRKKE